MKVGTNTISLGISVSESAAKQHLVGRQANARYGIARRESRLFDLGKKVIRIAVERHGAHLDERIILVGPDFGQIKGVEAIGFGFGIGHDLDMQGPAWVFAALDGVE